MRIESIPYHPDAYWDIYQKEQSWKNMMTWLKHLAWYNYIDEEIHKAWRQRNDPRDVLERIRKGELREAAINKLLSMKKLEVIEQIKEEIRSGKDE